MMSGRTTTKNNTKLSPAVSSPQAGSFMVERQYLLDEKALLAALRLVLDLPKTVVALTHEMKAKENKDVLLSV